MMPDLDPVVTAWLKQQADTFKIAARLDDVVPTFLPPAQVDAEVCVQRCPLHLCAAVGTQAVHALGGEGCSAAMLWPRRPREMHWAMFGLHVKHAECCITLLLLQVQFQLQHNLANSHDGWIMQPSDFGSVAREDGFFPLDSIVNDPASGMAQITTCRDVAGILWEEVKLNVLFHVNVTLCSGLDWSDVLPYVSTRHVTYQGNVVALPLDLKIGLLFYRSEALNPSSAWRRSVLL
jgi:hypothetical protein